MNTDNGAHHGSVGTSAFTHRPSATVDRVKPLGATMVNGAAKTTKFPAAVLKRESMWKVGEHKSYETQDASLPPHSISMKLVVENAMMVAILVMTSCSV